MCGPGPCSGRGMVLGVQASERAAARTYTMPRVCVYVQRWRELSRNKSRDEREMWSNRSSHTDTVFHGCCARKRERDIPRLQTIFVPFPSCNLRHCVAVRIFEQFQTGHPECQRSGSPSGSKVILSLEMNATTLPSNVRHDAFKSSR